MSDVRRRSLMCKNVARLTLQQGFRATCFIIMWDGIMPLFVADCCLFAISKMHMKIGKLHENMPFSGLQKC